MVRKWEYSQDFTCEKPSKGSISAFETPDLHSFSLLQGRPVAQAGCMEDVTAGGSGYGGGTTGFQADPWHLCTVEQIDIPMASGHGL